MMQEALEERVERTERELKEMKEFMMTMSKNMEKLTVAVRENQRYLATVLSDMTGGSLRLEPMVSMEDRDIALKLWANLNTNGQNSNCHRGRKNFEGEKKEMIATGENKTGGRFIDTQQTRTVTLPDRGVAASRDRGMKRLTDVEYQAKREKGLCLRLLLIGRSTRTTRWWAGKDSASLKATLPGCDRRPLWRGQRCSSRKVKKKKREKTSKCCRKLWPPDEKWEVGGQEENGEKKRKMFVGSFGRQTRNQWRVEKRAGVLKLTGGQRKKKKTNVLKPTDDAKMILLLKVAKSRW